MPNSTPGSLKKTLTTPEKPSKMPGLSLRAFHSMVLGLLVFPAPEAGYELS